MTFSQWMDWIEDVLMVVFHGEPGTKVHDDHVVVVEYLKPDPKGPYWVMSDYAEPTWAERKFKEPR